MNPQDSRAFQQKWERRVTSDLPKVSQALDLTFGRFNKPHDIDVG